MEYFDNMDQDNFSEDPNQHNDESGGNDATGFSFGDDIDPSQNGEDFTTGEDGEQDESTVDEQAEKPKKKGRKKKADSSADDSEDEKDFSDDGGESEDSFFPDSEYTDEDSSFDANGESENGTGDESTGANEQDDALQEDTGARPVERFVGSDSLDAESESLDTGPDNPPMQPIRRRSAASRRPTVLDASGNVIFDRTDSGQHDMSVLTAARNSRRVLTATVDGIETDGEALPRVVFYQGIVKIMIPFSQMGFDLDPETVSQREARLLIDSMLGAKIDYMVRGVDTEARVAGASRRDAMLMRQRTILNARSTGVNSEYRINEGMRVTARIIHVSRNTVRVEVFGFESYVRIDNISNLWVNDIREVIQVGEERPVEIIALQRDESGRVASMRVSMKAAEDAPQLELREGNTYTGTISNFSDTAYFVRVAGIPMEVRCPIKSNHAMEMMNQGDYVKFYIRGIYDGVPTGAILKIIKKKLMPGL